MDKLHTFYYFLDLGGTFAFALSGAIAARERGLDLFGICAIAFTVACGGGSAGRVNDVVLSFYFNGGCSDDNWFIPSCKTT